MGFQPWMIGFVLLMLSTSAMYFGYIWALHRRMKATCRTEGHQWESEEGGLRCRRCMQRPSMMISGRG